MNRLILFDIDGTLLWPGKAPRLCLAKALEAEFGTAGDIGGYAFGGRTDPRIISDLMRGAGFSDSRISAGIPSVFQFYLNELARELHPADMILYPGTRALLIALGCADDAGLGLVTGNIQAGARIKLGCFNLNSFFAVGAFGSDSADRNDLPAIALMRASAAYGRDFSGEETVVVGDSVHDISCARACGMRVVAVATGKTGREDLLSLKPDGFLENFDDTDLAVSTILKR